VRNAADLPSLAPLVSSVVLLELAAGTALASHAVDITGRVGRGFVGTTALICAVLMGVDLLLDGALPDPATLLGSGLDAGSVATAAHWAVAFTVLLVADALFCGVGTDIARRVVGAATVIAGGVAVGAAATALGPGLGGTAGAATAFSVGALLLGSCLSGMLLGHWYLISPSMSFRPLRQAVWMVFGAVAVEVVVIIAVLVMSDQNTRHVVIAGADAPAFWLFVVGAGVLFTALVNGLTLYFARIRANQPATAMLYALIISAAIGVVPAHLVYFLSGAAV
jgi:hypothetical protein